MMERHGWKLWIVSVLVFGCAVGWADRVKADLVINLNFISSGEIFESLGSIAGGAPANAVGGGDLQSVMETAAGMWAAVIKDDFVTTIDYGWVARFGAVAADTRNTSGTNTVSSIRFDNDGSTLFYIDPTPGSHSEWGTYTEVYQDVGGGVINTGRTYTGATGDASGRVDLLTVALHEIGHSLGFSAEVEAFITENIDLDIDVAGALPGAGSVINTEAGAHISSSQLGSSLLTPATAVSTRTLVSGADFAAVGQVGGFSVVDGSEVRVPGDTDGDGAVTVSDLSTFALNFGTSPGLGSYDLGDFNSDGDVAVSDLSILALNFGFDAFDGSSIGLGLSVEDLAAMGGIDLSVVVVPEPGVGLMLVCIGGVVLLSRRDSV